MCCKSGDAAGRSLEGVTEAHEAGGVQYGEEEQDSFLVVAAASSEDPVWLAQFDNKSFTEQQMMKWQLWFLNNQRLAIKKLEELK